MFNTPANGSATVPLLGEDTLIDVVIPANLMPELYIESGAFGEYRCVCYALIRAVNMYKMTVRGSGVKIPDPRSGCSN